MKGSTDKVEVQVKVKLNESSDLIQSFYQLTCDIIVNTHLEKSTHFSMIFLGDRRLHMIPMKSG